MTFQRLLDRLFFDIPCVFVYLDDLLVASHSVEEHRVHLRAVLQRLHDNGLVINVGKCVWGQSSLEFLDHQVSAAGVAPLASRIEAVKNFPCPHTVLYSSFRHFWASISTGVSYPLPQPSFAR
jgi:cleavage and polyadenylation specificity factor subunit 1